MPEDLPDCAWCEGSETHSHCGLCDRVTKPGAKLCPRCRRDVAPRT